MLLLQVYNNEARENSSEACTNPLAAKPSSLGMAKSEGSEQRKESLESQTFLTSRMNNEELLPSVHESTHF